MDRLDNMFTKQIALQRLVNKGKELDEFTLEERIDAIKENVLGCTDELHEALSEVGWKSWATSHHINEELFKGELIDAWHMLMNLMLHAGMSSEEVYDRYNTKYAKNIKRYTQEYDGVAGKCPVCHRALDDLANGFTAPELICDGTVVGCKFQDLA